MVKICAAANNLTSAYILACRAGTTSRYSMGETPPMKAEQAGLWSHLGSTCLRGNTSTRIWTRALQPVQEEVSSWRFRRAQIVSGPPTFSADISLGAEILMSAKILSSAYIFARRQHFRGRQYFVHLPMFSWDANIVDIRQCFHEMPIFFWISANVFMRRQYFGYPPMFSWDANILGSCQYFGGRQYFVDLLDFVTANIWVNFQYLFLCI